MLLILAFKSHKYADLCELKTNLNYRANSKIAKATKENLSWKNQ